MVFVDFFGVDRIRAVFLNISPTLMDYLTQGRPAIVAAAILVAASAAAGTGGAVYRVLPDSVRKPLGSAVWVTLLFGFLQRIVPIALDQLDVERDWLYSKVTRGLTWPGAIVIALVTAGVSVLKASQRRRRSAERSGVAAIASGSGVAAHPAQHRAGAGRPGRGPRGAARARVGDLRGARHRHGLRAAGHRTQHRGRLRGAARPRLRLLLHARCVLVGAADRGHAEHVRGIVGSGGRARSQLLRRGPGRRRDRGDRRRLDRRARAPAARRLSGPRDPRVWAR